MAFPHHPTCTILESPNRQNWIRPLVDQPITKEYPIQYIPFELQVSGILENLYLIKIKNLSTSTMYSYFFSFWNLVLMLMWASKSLVAPNYRCQRIGSWKLLELLVLKVYNREIPWVLIILRTSQESSEDSSVGCLSNQTWKMKYIESFSIVIYMK